jgi:hypothetical protein
MTRAEPYAESHRLSQRGKGDRLNIRPRGLRSLLRWAQAQWVLEVPGRLHDRDIADDGAPDFAPQAARYLGTGRPAGGSEPWDTKRSPGWDKADDWSRLACSTDTDGSYRTPMHCVVAGFPPEQRRYLRDLLTDLYHPVDIAELHGLPAWAHESVARDLLSTAWDRYRESPLPRRSRLSDAQLDAEAAA